LKSLVSLISYVGFQHIFLKINKKLSKTSSHISQEIVKAQSGDQNAFTKILDYYWSEVYFFILKRSGNETEAEDITIQTFSKAFEKIATYNNEFAFNTWLLTIAKNLHIDWIRKQQPNQFVEIDDDEENPYFNIPDESPTIEDQLIHEQNLANLKAYIKQLKPHYQQIIQLRYFQEMSYNEIAEEINEPLANVKVKLLRAKKLLTELIQNKKEKQ